MIHLDTHVVAWLWAGDPEPLAPVTRTLESEDLVISPMVTLELQYLHEIGRLADPASEIVGDLVHRIGLASSGASLAEIVERSLELRWTRDPFDRLIVANAIADGCKLLTRDATIRKHFRGARWGRSPHAR